MTFDDGPTSNTGQLLEILREKGIRATFHLTTKYLTDPAVQSMVQRIASSGHLIGLRTEASWNLLTMSDDQIRSSVARQANVMASFIGYYPKFIRLPYNGYDERVLRAVESTGAVVTTHNLESYDYTGDGNRIVNSFQLALSLAGSGGNFISIQHDSIPSSVAVTPKVIDGIKGAGYKFVTLDACLGMGDMTKNKSALKGGAGGDSQALPMSQGGADAPPMAGGKDATGAGAGPAAGGAANNKDFAEEGENGKLAGQKKNSAASAAFGSIGMVLLVTAVNILGQLVF